MASTPARSSGSAARAGVRARRPAARAGRRANLRIGGLRSTDGFADDPREDEGRSGLLQGGEGGERRGVGIILRLCELRAGLAGVGVQGERQELAGDEAEVDAAVDEAVRRVRGLRVDELLEVDLLLRVAPVRRETDLDGGDDIAVEILGTRDTDLGEPR